MATASRTDEFKKLILRLDQHCIQHFQGAMSLCASRAHFEVTPEHLLLRLLDDSSGDVNQIFSTFKIDRAPIRRAVQRILDEMPSGNRNRPAVSPKLVELLQSGLVLSEDAGLENIRAGMLILAFALNPNHTRVGEFTPEFERIDTEQLRNHFDEIVGAGGGAGGEAGGQPAAEGAPAGRGEGSALDQFTVDLTAKAAGGHIDPVFGRDPEIRQMIDIFARRRKNNPILVGEPGTGKTAVVEGLALRIVKGDVPPTLKGVKLICLDLGLLQAGAGIKGEFENRLKNVIREIKASTTPIVTFIDEAHTLIGAGAQAGGSDAANMLKPALARGELRTVAATTWAEYKKYFEKDAALERRFQLVRCDEPSAENAIVMLRGLKDKYEQHHKVIILDEAVTAAVHISKRYISGRFLPDKAVDLLDTAAARVGTGLNTRPAILDDLDRRIGALDTAIAAMQRDKEGGVIIEAEQLAEMDKSRTALLEEREQTEAHWKAELDAVNKVRELRSKLSCYRDDSAKPAPAEEAKAPAAAAKPDAKAAPAAAAAPAPAVEVNEDEIRAKIDEAVKEMKAIQGQEPMLFPHVDASTIAAIVSDWTGIPVGKMVSDEITAVLQMEDRLRERVVGQDHALKTIAQKLRAARSGLKNPVQPMGVFLCVGPSGVGKTELALAVSDLLFGGDSFLTSINMSEFMESHTVSQLKGSPPGYVGYGEGGVLTEAVRQHPYSVVLLDEVEKAHPDVMNLFYQVFDKGSLADGEGRVIDFKNTVIFLTSNLGTDAIQGMCESGDVDIPTLYEAVYPHLRNHFKPALVARMTVIPFLTLSQEVLSNIARLKVKKLGDRLTTAHKIVMKVDEPVYAHMAGKCNQVDIGARQIDHLIDQAILPELSLKLLEQMAAEKMPTVLTLGVSEAGEFTYTFSS